MLSGKGRGPSTPSPALLTSNIKNVRTLDNLFGIVATYVADFNHIHLSACWNTLGQLAPPAENAWAQHYASTLSQLTHRTSSVAATSGAVRARELANIVHGVAKSGQGSAMVALLANLAEVIANRIGECNTQELANVAWAYAKADHQAPALFDAIAAAAERRIGDFNAQELSNTAHAFARAGHASPALFGVIASRAMARLDEFTPQGIANTAWAYATAGHTVPELFDAVVAASLPRLSEFNPQDLANTVYAFAKAGHASPPLFEAIAAASAPRLSEFTPQGLANTVWAYATSGHGAKTLFDSVAMVSIPRLRDFDPQAMANAAWAYAKACHPNAQLFSALARVAEQSLGEFNTQDLVNTAWSFAKLGHFDGAMFAAVARSMATRRMDELSAPHIANIAWAFSKVAQIDALSPSAIDVSTTKLLFAALARSAERRAGDFNAQDLANIAWAFANARQLDASLFASLGRSAERCQHTFSDEELDNAEWAFAMAGQQKIVHVLRQRRKCAVAAQGALAGPAVDASKCGRIIVAGGGIGGAAVAVALQNRGFDVVVLEADRSFDARKQGYGLTIQGQEAMQAMGISLAQDDAPSTSHYVFSAEGHILGFFGEAFGDKSKARRQSDNSGRFVHIPRQVLRSRIVDLIRPGTIRWGSKLQDFACWNKGEGGRSHHGVTVTLTDGTTLDAALLVGSDGIFSTVRRQLRLPGDRLNYVGLVVVLGIVEGPMAVPLAERRIFETVDGTTRIYAMPFTTRSTMWQLSFPYAEDAAQALVKDAVALKAEIVRRCCKWHEPIPALLRATPLDAMSGYAVYDRDLLEPHVLRKPPSEAATAELSTRRAAQSRVTLIGDAAHPMTPFKAQGANQALSDAVLLANTLAASVEEHGPQHGFDVALPQFEQKMLQRSSRMVVGSREKAKELHSKLALQPARKVQRETGANMQKAIRVLRAKGIGAHSAADPRGLDAVVVQAIEESPSSSDSSTTDAAKEIDKLQGEGALSGRQAKRCWGYVGDDWHRCILLKTDAQGRHKVKWKDGRTSVLAADCIQPRSKKQKI